jgi:integrase
MARIANFLEQYSKPATRSGYRSAVLAYLSFINGVVRDGKKIIRTDELNQYENLADRYFIEDRNYEADLIQFSKHCGTAYAPTTGTYYHSAVREFLVFNDVELSSKQKRNLKNKITRGGPVSEEEDLTKAMIRGLMTSCDLMLQAMILVMLTSGLRISETLGLTMNDVKISPDGQYAVITLRGVRKGTGQGGTKNAHGRTTFVNREAVELLNRWLEVRGAYVAAKASRPERFTPRAPGSGRVFPCCKSNVESLMRTALKNSGLLKTDADTNRATIHPHLFRKYFITQMTNAGTPEKFVDFFAGHLGQLDRAYQRQTTEKLLEVYLKGEPHLRIYDDSAVDVAKTQEEITQTRDRVRDVQLDSLMTKSKMADIIEQNERLTKEMEILKAQAAEQARARETADPRYIKGAADKDFVEAVARKMLELQKK